MSNIEELSKLFGTDLSELSGHAGPEMPKTVPGRVLHIDGDFLAYQVSADNEKSLDEMKHNHDVATETLRLLAGAERAVSHLTASSGDKGNRYNIAIQKEYQANRKNKEKPQHLYTIKEWMVRERGAFNHVDQEADDGLAQANVAAVNGGYEELSVLVSKDKDLQMVPGYHLAWEEGTLEYVKGFGYVELNRDKSSPKIVGKGTAYFWAQMLTGDAADNIAGLPTLPGFVLNKIKPTQDTEKCLAVLNDPDAPEAQKLKARAKLDARKSGKCGPVAAFDIVSRFKNDKDAFEFTKMLYKSHGEREGFKHWATGEAVDWQKVMLSEAKLLWMRHTKDENDVLHFLQRECQ